MVVGASSADEGVRRIVGPQERAPSVWATSRAACFEVSHGRPAPMAQSLSARDDRIPVMRRSYGPQATECGRSVKSSSMGAGQGIGRGRILADATDVSDDGRAIVGYGTNPDGMTEAWLAVISTTSFRAEHFEVYDVRDKGIGKINVELKGQFDNDFRDATVTPSRISRRPSAEPRGDSGIPTPTWPFSASAVATNRGERSCFATNLESTRS